MTRAPAVPGLLGAEINLARARLEAIADPKNHLTARVMVNRIWQHHFGTGLVRTPSDFGMRSEPPTHPELLDHLATTFMEQGWSVKKMHRLMMLSATYQQRSDERDDIRRIDPDIRLMARTNRRRLDFEALRDSFLVVSNRLDRTVGGPAQGNLLGSNRRTVYGSVERLNLPGLFRTFDFPSPPPPAPARSNHSAAAACSDEQPVPDRCVAACCSGRILPVKRFAEGGSPASPALRATGDRQELALAREYLATTRRPAWDRCAQAAAGE